MLVYIEQCYVYVIELSFCILYFYRKSIDKGAANLENYQLVLVSKNTSYPVSPFPHPPLGGIPGEMNTQGVALDVNTVSVHNWPQFM